MKLECVLCGADRTQEFTCDNCTESLDADDLAARRWDRDASDMCDRLDGFYAAWHARNAEIEALHKANTTLREQLDAANAEIARLRPECDAFRAAPPRS